MRRWFVRLVVGSLAAVAMVAVTGLPAPAAEAPPDSVFAHADRLLRAGAPDSVLSRIGPLVDAALAAGDSSLVLRGRLHLAGALALSGRLREAEATARQSRAMAAREGQPGAARLATRWLGYALLGQGRGEEAQQIYLGLRDESAVAGDRREEAYAQMGLAYLALGRGENADARVGYETAASLFDEVGEQGMALDCQVGLARTLGREGRYGEMRDLYARILVAGEAAGLQRVVGYALNNLGSYEYQTGDPGLAVTYWERVLDARMLEGDAGAAVTPKLNLALALMEMGAFDEAVAAVRELGEDCRANGYRAKEAAVLAQLAAMEAARGNDTGAVGIWRQLMVMTEAGQDGRLDAALGVARTLTDNGRPAAAVALCDSVRQGMMAGATPLQRSELDLADAASRAALGRDDQAVPLAARAYAVAREGGYRQTEMAALLALSRSERALASQGDGQAVLADSALAHLRAAQRRWADLRSAPRDPRWREQRGALGSAIHLELATLLLAEPATAPVEERVRAAFAALQGYKARTLLERMLGPDAFAPDAVAQTPPTLAQVQDGILAPGEVLLDFYLGENETLMFAVTRGDCRVVRLPGRVVLGPQVRLFLDLVAVPPADGGGAGYLPAARRLAAGILAPVTAELDDATQVVIAADGLLNRLPFELLPLETAAGRATALGDARDVARVPSVMVLANLRRAARPDRPRGVLVLDGAGADGPEALPGAAAEVRLLRRGFRDVLLTSPGCGAADGAWTADLAGRAALHVPAHTETFDQRPWASRIAVGRTDPATACWLTSAEVTALRLPPGLVVLSGCSSAGGRALSGEGVLGLTGAFLTAGSQAVVASLWDMDDAATAAFMAPFYDALADGRTVAGALAVARRKLAQSATMAAPCYWAGFVVVGEGGLPVPLQRRPGTTPELLAAGAAVAGAIFAIVQFVRRRRVISRRRRSLP